MAAENGCWFSEDHGQYVVDWIEANCVLWEGFDGLPMILEDWQYDATMRLFGWLRYSESTAHRDKRTHDLSVKVGKEPPISPDQFGIIRRFTQASIFIAKKNGKTPTAAAWGLYLLCGDREHGQKIYLVSKDGQHTRELTAKHAMNMVEMSPTLNEQIVRKVLPWSLTNPATMSQMIISSGTNRHSQQGNQGGNGSVIIDELHVVSKSMWDVVEKHGQVRREPLLITVSTAGADSASFGKRRFDLAMKVEKGEIEQQNHLAIIYAAPQDVTDEEIHKDPIKFGKMANPSWGRIIKEDEFLSTYKQARLNTEDWVKFLWENLNIWSSSASPWLDMNRWVKCDGGFTEDDLYGLPCWGGFDRADTHDATTLSLWFHFKGRPHLLTFIWIPEDIARKEVPLGIEWDTWMANGDVRMVPGPVVTDEYLVDELLEIREKFDIQDLVFDPYHNRWLMKTLERDHDWEWGSYAQTLANLSDPIREFERLVLLEKLRHDGNPCLTWMANNAHLMVHQNRGCRIVKPHSAKDRERIDGIVSAVMGYGRFRDEEFIGEEEEVNPYDLPQEERVLWL